MDLGRFPNMPLMIRSHPAVALPLACSPALGQTQQIEITSRCGQGTGPFAPAPGDRLSPSLPGPGSPWWKADAAVDPWRDPQSPYWIAGPPVYADDEVIGMAEAVEDAEPGADAEDA